MASGCPRALGRLMPYARNVTPEAVVTDATAYVGWLDGQEAVDTSRKIGVVGFCMSGPYTIRAAAALPDRVGAAASLHGAGVATEAPTSPHLLAPETKAVFLFAIAENDDAEDPQSKERLKAAFGDRAEVEVYPANHGWVPIDSPRYDEAQAERAWSRLLGGAELARACPAMSRVGTASAGDEASGQIGRQSEKSRPGAARD